MTLHLHCGRQDVFHLLFVKLVDFTWLLNWMTPFKKFFGTAAQFPWQHKVNVFILVCPNSYHCLLHLCPSPLSTLQPTPPHLIPPHVSIFDVRSICMSRLRRDKEREKGDSSWRGSGIFQLCVGRGETLRQQPPPMWQQSTQQEQSCWAIQTRYHRRELTFICVHWHTYTQTWNPHA